MSLPLYTFADDVEEIISYLRNKAMGVTIEEARSVLDNRLLDGRKMAAYRSWKIIHDDDSQRLNLTSLGWRAARDQISSEELIQEIIHSTEAYVSTLEWAYYQKFSEITATDVVVHWTQHHPTAVSDREKGANDQAVCFLQLCERAGLGSFIRGRRGQQTRLELNTMALEKFVLAGEIVPNPQVNAQNTVIEEEAQLEIDNDFDDGPQSLSITPVEESTEPQLIALHSPPFTETNEIERVFVSHGKNMQIVKQVIELLELSDIDTEIAVADETPAIPVPEKVFAAMRRCQAGVIIVSVEEGKTDNEGTYTINENVLIEIGAAFVLYDRRVILVWDKRIPIPSNLQGLYRCEFEGDELSWAAGMKLAKTIQEFDI